jgi:hypothetical protein
MTQQNGWAGRQASNMAEKTTFAKAQRQEQMCSSDLNVNTGTAKFKNAGLIQDVRVGPKMLYF